MAQIIVRNLDDDVRDKLRQLALKQGRSMENMIREVLRNVALAASEPQEGLGTRLERRFSKYRLDEELPSLPRQVLEPPSFSE